AEDGIRDKLVTGVQTCALPISNTRWMAAFAVSLIAGACLPGAVNCRAATKEAAEATEMMSGFNAEERAAAVARAKDAAWKPACRSEERRVGKGGRGGGWRGPKR